jgi:hypothetical protein
MIDLIKTCSAAKRGWFEKIKKTLDDISKIYY